MQGIITKGKGWVKLRIHPKVYSLASVYSAGYVFLDKAYLYLDKDSKQRIIAWLFPKNKKEDLQKLGLNFYNELINYSHYFSSLIANAEAMKTLDVVDRHSVGCPLRAEEVVHEQVAGGEAMEDEPI